MLRLYHPVDQSRHQFAHSARETAEKVEDSIRKTEQGVELGRKIAANFQEILGKTRSVDELVGEIATASKEQSSGITSVNTAVSAMDAVTQSKAKAGKGKAGGKNGQDARAAYYDRISKLDMAPLWVVLKEHCIMANCLKV